MRARELSRRVLLRVGLVLVVSATLVRPVQAATPTVTVSGPQWGVSTCYIGATEGNFRFNINFNINDLTDLGINTYRIYGGMLRWEAQDDDGVYGSPSIAQIEANPSVINWSWWDQVMITRTNGTDYWWSGDSGLWQGNAATIFGQLQAAGIRPVLTLRNSDNNNNPSWSPNPPTTTSDWNEWWEHVFATAYWLNVRNNYHVDDYEVHNEPNNSRQGWGGTEAQYFQLVHNTHDALDFLYRTYLPGRTYHVYAPVTSGGSSWPNDALQQVPTYFDSVDVHDYSSNISSYVEQVHGWINSTGHSSYPLWLSEWGTYKGKYGSISFDVGVINNLIRGSQPGNDYVYGSHIFSMYDWNGFSGGFQSFQGLVDGSGNRRPGYYALRLGIRALQGCRPTYHSTTSASNLLAITTKDPSSGNIYLLVTNSGNTSYTVDANLSALLTTGIGTEWQFNSTYMDAITGKPALSNGHVTLTVAGKTAVLVKF